MAELLMDGIEKKYDSGNFAVENFIYRLKIMSLLFLSDLQDAGNRQY